MTEVKLIVNDKEVPLNDFIKEIFANINKGVLNSLKEIPNKIETIKIDINW